MHNSMKWDMLLLKTEQSVFVVSKHESYCHTTRSGFQLWIKLLEVLHMQIAASRFGHQSPSEDDNIEIAVKVWVFVTMPVEASSNDI